MALDGRSMPAAPPLVIAAPKLFGICLPNVGEATREGLPPYIEPGRAILEGEGVPGGGIGDVRPLLVPRGGVPEPLNFFWVNVTEKIA